MLISTKVEDICVSPRLPEDFSSTALEWAFQLKRQGEEKHQMRTAHIISFLKKVPGLPQTKKKQTVFSDSNVKDTSSASRPTNPPLPSLTCNMPAQPMSCPCSFVSLCLCTCELSFLGCSPLLLNSSSFFKTQPKWDRVWLSPFHSDRPLWSLSTS